MKAALLLIDLQRDFLSDGQLEPSAGRIVERAACVLEAARRAGLLVIHVVTLIDSIEDAMPHWRAAARPRCLRGTEGARSPADLEPLVGELVIEKTFFSAFTNHSLIEALRAGGIDELIVAGVHAHACIRASALDGYQNGFRVIIASDATGSYDPLHQEMTRLHLDGRAVKFLEAAEIASRIIDSPRDLRACQPHSVIRLAEPGRRQNMVGEVLISNRERVAAAAKSACAASMRWTRTTAAQRGALFATLEQRLVSESASLVGQLVRDVGKPITAARAELDFARQLLRAACTWHDNHSMQSNGADWRVHAQPHGVVALITPWNNPLAIPLGKIVPALLYGNAALWKPSPAGTPIAERLLEILIATGFPDGLVELVTGDRSSAELVMECEGVEAVSITGSSASGYTAQAISGKRRIPLQAELGGNNAAIVLADAPIDTTSQAIALGAMGFAGQRCTANRRVIVPANALKEWVGALSGAVAGLAWGDPEDERTIIGPMISDAACEAVAAVVQRAEAHGATSLQTHSEEQWSELSARGSYHPPTIVIAGDPTSEIVQQESFGPVLVVQPADDWEHALALCNGVRQGLVASLFTKTEARHREFLARCRAGILKLNAATAAVAAEPPFCGWKASGLGPPEHGIGDPMFYTKLQTIYADRNPHA